MISNNSDLYTTIEALIHQLNAAGEQDWSSVLNDALSISTVPGEILGETRLQLRQLQETPIPSRLGGDWRVDEKLAYLDQILGP